MLTPALYRTRIDHSRREPVRHDVRHRGYSWYIDIDEPPRLPRWLRPFARFDARDHFDGDGDTLRERVEDFLSAHDVHLHGGAVTALLQARVLGYTFNPLSVYWCHDSHGVLRHVIAEVHNTYGGRHAYLLPATETRAATVDKALYVSPFNDVSGQYRVRAPRPDDSLDVRIALHRDDQPPFVVTMRGSRRAATVRQVVRMQFVAPLAPLFGSLMIRVHGIWLWLRRVPVVPRPAASRQEEVRRA